MRVDISQFEACKVLLTKSWSFHQYMGPQSLIYLFFTICEVVYSFLIHLSVIELERLCILF